MYNRIAIIGGSGTGKTTLSNALSKKYNIPATHIDGIHHLKDWQIRDKSERDKIILDIVKKSKKGYKLSEDPLFANDIEDIKRT